jgi:hypothetical protein
MVNQDPLAIPQRDVAAVVVAAFRSGRLYDDEMVYREADNVPLSLSHTLQHRMMWLPRDLHAYHSYL